MSSFKPLALILFGLVLFFGAGGFLISPDWQVTRSVVIHAPAEAVHEHVVNLHNWEAWSPFEEEDPTMRFVYQGPEAGAGARRSWTSEQGRDGWMEITADTPGRGIRYVIGMDDQEFAGAMTYEAASNGTQVIWTHHGTLGDNPLRRWMALMMDSLLGSQLERGLDNLKRLSESTAG